MTAVRVELEERPRADDACVVTEGLRAFNRAVIGDPNERELAVFVRDASARVIGGLLGHVKWRWVYVAKLWLPDELRGRGVGTRVMRVIEEYARAHACLGIYLDTFEYQALPFYEKLGYVQFGVLEGYPPGYRQFHLFKTLRDEGT
ncbi:MAG TPA: GNAT family N-acetyltransferase [Gemmatimonadaceae bacterium]|nr:GNAT family N-acetyltransferase [Gemmatimonadaceae bacterium]